eukprot:762427-Hanusia_phi.AAC.1
MKIGGRFCMRQHGLWIALANAQSISPCAVCCVGLGLAEPWRPSWVRLEKDMETEILAHYLCEHSHRDKPASASAEGQRSRLNFQLSAPPSSAATGYMKLREHAAWCVWVVSLSETGSLTLRTDVLGVPMLCISSFGQVQQVVQDKYNTWYN